MNKPVAWIAIGDNTSVFFDLDTALSIDDNPTPLYTPNQLEEARKLGMQQERALWNLSESTQEFESFDRTASHMAGEYVAHKELNDGGEPVKNATYWKRQYNLMATQNDNLKSGLYHANEQIKYLETHPVKELTDEEIIGLWNDLVDRILLRKAQEK